MEDKKMNFYSNKFKRVVATVIVVVLVLSMVIPYIVSVLS